MHHFSKRSTPIMAEEAMLILGLGRGDYHGLLRAGRLPRSVRSRGDPACGVGQHSFWDLLGCDLWRLFRLAGLPEPAAGLLAEEVGDLLAEAEERAGLDGSPRARLQAHPFASRMGGHHDALLGATIGVLRQTHDLLWGGPPRPDGPRLVATLPGDGPPGLRVLEMGLRRPGEAAPDGPWPACVAPRRADP